MKRISIELDDEDYAVLVMAAEIAQRDPATFVREEALSLADLIAAQGSLKDIKLARHRDADARAFIEAFAKSEGKHKPIREWVRRQGLNTNGDD